MKTTISRYDFERAFVDAGRKDQFSYEALGLLYDYLEEYEESTGEEIVLDVIALCCDYCEDDILSIFNTYPISCESENPSLDEIQDAVSEYLQENTQLVGETSTGFVYACF